MDGAVTSRHSVPIFTNKMKLRGLSCVEHSSSSRACLSLLPFSPLPTPAFPSPSFPFLSLSIPAFPSFRASEVWLSVPCIHPINWKLPWVHSVAGSCSHQPDLILELFHPLPKPRPVNRSSASLLSSHRQPLIHFLSLPISLVGTFHRSGIMWCGLP